MKPPAKQKLNDLKKARPADPKDAAYAVMDLYAEGETSTTPRLSIVRCPDLT